jgi:hypothetical protein
MFLFGHRIGDEIDVPLITHVIRKIASTATVAISPPSKTQPVQLHGRMRGA